MKTITCAKLPDQEQLEYGAEYVLPPNNFDMQYYLKRVNRNIGWVTHQEQVEIILEEGVAVVGVGGMGGEVASRLKRLGLGRLKYGDGEKFDISNINRQLGASKSTVGISKTKATCDLLRDIADDTTDIVYPQGLTELTAERFISDVSVICDEIEFWALGSRMLLHQTMRKQKNAIILCTPTVGHSMFVFKYTHDSMPIEEVFGITYEDAMYLQQAIEQKTATKNEIEVVMEIMLRFAAPVIPEYSRDVGKYSSVKALRDRLFIEGKASIIATNPGMAAGYLANQVLFHLLEKSSIKRKVVLPPPMPGYVMFDAGFCEAKRVSTKWW